jgi:hypothetical protein
MTNYQQGMFRQPGNYSVEAEKLRVTTPLGMNSVLFEDISSISFIKCSRPDFKFMLYGFILFVTLMVIGINSESVGMWFSIGLLIFVTSCFVSWFNQVKWDNVIIETRGGMMLLYSVDEGEGITQVDSIEKDKRRVTGISN